jgi:hypothetical protein
MKPKSLWYSFGIAVPGRMKRDLKSFVCYRQGEQASESSPIVLGPHNVFLDVSHSTTENRIHPVMEGRVRGQNGRRGEMRRTQRGDEKTENIWGIALAHF